MQRYKYETQTSTEKKASELGINPYTDFGSNQLNQLMLRERLAAKGASVGSTVAPDLAASAWREDDSGRSLWFDPVYNHDGAGDKGIGVKGGVAQEDDFLGLFDIDIGAGQAGLIHEEGTTHAGASFSYGQIKVDEELDEDERMTCDFGVAAGFGLQGRVHHSDENHNGKTEYGFGFDAGWATYDLKTEDPLLTALTFPSGPSGMWLADELLPEDINLTEAAFGGGGVAADDLKSPVQIAKERKARGEQPAKPAEKDYSSMFDW